MVATGKIPDRRPFRCWLTDSTALLDRLLDALVENLVENLVGMVAHMGTDGGSAYEWQDEGTE